MPKGKLTPDRMLSRALVLEVLTSLSEESIMEDDYNGPKLESRAEVLKCTTGSLIGLDVLCPYFLCQCLRTSLKYLEIIFLPALSLA